MYRLQAHCPGENTTILFFQVFWFCAGLRCLQLLQTAAKKSTRHDKTDAGLRLTDLSQSKDQGRHTTGALEPKAWKNQRRRSV